MAQKFTVPITIKNLTSSGSDGVTVFLDQENYARLKLEAGGRIVWGDGTGAGDTNLYRSAANVLKTDDVFQAVAGVVTLSTSGSPSVSLDDGALAVDVTNNAFYFRSNGSWNQVTGGAGGGGATVTVSDTEPASPSVGDLWFESDTGSLFIYYDSVWLEIGGGTAFDSTAQYIEAKGDLLVGYGSASVENLSVGPNGYFLKANSSASLGVEWASIPTINALDDIGDVSASSPGSGDFLKWNGSAWVNDAINLGTDTVGNYVSDVTAGTGVSITHTPGEGSSAQVGIGQDVDISASVTFAHVSAGLTGNVTGNASTASALQTARTISLAGDVSGSVSFDGSQNVTITSAVQPNSVALGTDTTGNYVADVSGGTGVTVSHIAGEGTTPTVSIGQDVATSASVTFAHVSAPVTGTLTGSVIGNADTATALDTARIISLTGDVSGSVSFDGTSDASISAVIQPNSVALGTDTTGNYVSDVTAGTGVTVTHTPGEGSSPTVAIGQAVGTSSSVTFAHVNSDVTGNLTGNASTASALQNARTIQLSGDVSGSASFDGTSNINISTTVNTSSVAIGELNGVNITSPEEFQTLEYNGTEWVNAYAPVVSYVRNVESTTITTGTAVYLFGATGDHATVKRADNSSDTTSSKTVGLVAADIAASQNGPIVTRGYVDGINLSAYNPGDVLWLGKNGAFTTTKPSAPDHLVFIGVVVRATNNGIVYVATQNGYELEELHDVKITSATDGQFLRYNSASTVWVNDAINLGTDTVGNYVADVSGGTGVTVSHIAGEGSTPTVSIGQDVATSASVTFAHLVVQGDMEVQGTITRLSETNLDVDTAFIYLNANSASANPDMGLAFNYNDGTYKHAGFFRDSSDGIFKVFEGYTPEPVSPIDTSNPTYDDAPLQAERFISTIPTGTAPISVSSSTAVTNLNADYLDGQHGSYYAPINNPTFTGTVSLPNNTVALGTQTTGNYVADVSGGTGVTVTHTPGEGTTPSVAIGQDVATSASVTFAHVSAPITGNVAGNASTASALQNARTIALSGDVSGSVSFDGSANVTISSTIQPNSVALGTDTTGNYVADVVAGTGITVTHTPGEGSSASIALNTNLDGISDVTAPSPSSGDFLKWNGTAWVNDAIDLGTDTTGNYMVGVSAGTGISVSHTPGEGSSASISLNAALNDLTDVNLSVSPSDGQFLKYVSASSAWVASSIPTINSLDDIGDVNAPSPAVNDYLKWNGTYWTSASVDAGGAVTISDTTPGSPTAGDIWFESDTARTYVYYDSAWIEIGALSPSAIVSDSAPAAPAEGQIWFNSLNGGTYVYYDSVWTEIGAVPVNALLNTINAKGDLLVGTADNTVGRLPVGTNGYFLKANSSASAGIEWASIPTINALDDVGDVNVASATNGQYLQWNGTTWVPATVSADVMTDTRNAALIIMDIGA